LEWIFLARCCTIPAVRGSPLNFLHSAFRTQNTFRTDKVFDGYCSLQLMTAGSVELTYGAREYLLEGAWFWTGYPGPHIRFHVAPAHASWEHRHVAFCGPRMNEWLADHMLPLEPQRPPAGMNAAHLFDELLALMGQATHWATLRATNLLERLLLELAQDRAQPTTHEEPWLPEILQHLERSARSTNGNGNELPDYAELARGLGMSLSTLHRRFKRATGTTLHAYTLQCRVTAARDLLGETDLPIKLIAARLGYRDAFFFSRQFRSLTGASPAAYRRSRHA
jgi:AraC-like DNA-binding protein